MNKKNKKILFLIQTLEAAGGERVVSELSLNFPPNIEIITVLFKKKIHFSYKGKLICLNVSLCQKFFPKIYNLIVAFWRFRKIIKKERPDFIISFSNAPNIFNLFTKGKSILRFDNPFLKRKDFLGQIYLFLNKTLINKAEKVIVVSQGLKEHLIRNSRVEREKIKLIYNPINIKRIQELKKEDLEPEYQEIFKYPVIINIGRLLEQKGQEHLIRAFKEAKKIEKDLKLVILGEGKLESYLKNLTKSLGLENDIYFLGCQKNPFKFLARSKLFVLSSLWEGLGIVILEAMACDIPVISSDCKFGPREILAPDSDISYITKDVEITDCGILVPVGDEKALGKAIVKTLDDRSLSDSFVAKSKQRVRDFDVNKIIKEYNFLIN